MTNDYLPEFMKEVDCYDFLEWTKRNINYFTDNMAVLGMAGKRRELREWIEDFLDWSEYTENKNERP